MLILPILLTISALIALAAGIPQMIKLIKTKNSDEFNLGTWGMWVGTQTVSTAYAISIGDGLLMAINSAWVLFYLVMAALIVKYSPRKFRKAIAATQENPLEAS